LQQLIKEKHPSKKLDDVVSQADDVITEKQEFDSKLWLRMLEKLFGEQDASRLKEIIVKQAASQSLSAASSIRKDVTSSTPSSRSTSKSTTPRARQIRPDLKPVKP